MIEPSAMMSDDVIPLPLRPSSASDSKPGSSILPTRSLSRSLSGVDHNRTKQMAPFAALLATFAGHAAIGFLVWAGGPARVTPKQQPNDNVLSVRLTKTDATIERTLLPKAMSVPVNKQERTTDDSLVPIVQPVGPYYFRLSELTEKPVVVDDLVSTLVVRLAGLDPQPVVLRLLVSDEGRVDRVIVEESHLTEDVERELRETFARLRFEPGRIGRIAVRSQMRVEVRIETMERRLPG